MAKNLNNFVAVSLFLFPGYYLVFYEFLQISDGFYYITNAKNFFNSFELSNHIYEPPSRIISPQVGHIFLLALFHLFGEFWEIFFIAFQLLLFIYLIKNLDQLHGIKQNFSSISLVFLLILLINPSIYRAITTFYSESIFCLLFLLAIVDHEVSKKEKSSNLINIFLTFLLFFILPIYRIQSFVSLFPLLILSLFFYGVSIKKILSIIGLIMGSFISYLVRIFFMPTETSSLLFTFPSLDGLLLKINLLTRFFYDNQKIINFLPDWIEILISSLTSGLIIFALVFLFKRDKKLFFICSFILLANLIFLCFLKPNNIRYVVPVIYPIFFFFFLTLLKYKSLASIVKSTSTYLSGVIILILFLQVPLISSRNLYDYEIDNFSYPRIFKSVIEDESLKLYCSNARSVLYYADVKCFSDLSDNWFNHIEPSKEEAYLLIGPKEEVKRFLFKYGFDGINLQEYKQFTILRAIPRE